MGPSRGVPPDCVVEPVHIAADRLGRRLDEASCLAVGQLVFVHADSTCDEAFDHPIGFYPDNHVRVAVSELCGRAEVLMRAGENGDVTPEIPEPCPVTASQSRARRSRRFSTAAACRSATCHTRWLASTWAS